MEEQFLIEGDGCYTIIHKSSIVIGCEEEKELVCGAEIRYLWPEESDKDQITYNGKIVAISSNEANLRHLQNQWLQKAKKIHETRKRKSNNLSTSTRITSNVQQRNDENVKMKRRRKLLRKKANVSSAKEILKSLDENKTSCSSLASFKNKLNVGLRLAKNLMDHFEDFKKDLEEFKPCCHADFPKRELSPAKRLTCNTPTSRHDSSVPMSSKTSDSLSHSNPTEKYTKPHDLQDSILSSNVSVPTRNHSVFPTKEKIARISKSSNIIQDDNSGYAAENESRFTDSQESMVSPNNKPSHSPASPNNYNSLTEFSSFGLVQDYGTEDETEDEARIPSKNTRPLLSSDDQNDQVVQRRAEDMKRLKTSNINSDYDSNHAAENGSRCSDLEEAMVSPNEKSSHSSASQNNYNTLTDSTNFGLVQDYQTDDEREDEARISSKKTHPLRYSDDPNDQVIQRISKVINRLETSKTIPNYNSDHAAKDASVFSNLENSIVPPKNAPFDSLDSQNNSNSLPGSSIFALVQDYHSDDEIEEAKIPPKKTHPLRPSDDPNNQIAQKRAKVTKRPKNSNIITANNSDQAKENDLSSSHSQKSKIPTENAPSHSSVSRNDSKSLTGSSSFGLVQNDSTDDEREEESRVPSKNKLYSRSSNSRNKQVLQKTEKTDKNAKTFDKLKHHIPREEEEYEEGEEPNSNSDSEDFDINESLFLYTIKTAADKAVELIPGSKIFIEKKALHYAKKNGSQSTVARALLCSIFTEKALLTHSLFGKGKSDDKKKGFPKYAISAILKFARAIAKNANWKIVDDRIVKDSLRNKLRELRKKNA